MKNLIKQIKEASRNIVAADVSPEKELAVIASGNKYQIEIFESKKKWFEEYKADPVLRVLEDWRHASTHLITKEMRLIHINGRKSKKEASPEVISKYSQLKKKLEAFDKQFEEIMKPEKLAEIRRHWNDGDNDYVIRQIEYTIRDIRRRIDYDRKSLEYYRDDETMEDTKFWWRKSIKEGEERIKELEAELRALRPAEEPALEVKKPAAQGPDRSAEAFRALLESRRLKTLSPTAGAPEAPAQEPEEAQEPETPEEPASEEPKEPEAPKPEEVKAPETPEELRAEAKRLRELAAELEARAKKLEEEEARRKRLEEARRRLKKAEEEAAKAREREAKARKARKAAEAKAKKLAKALKELEGGEEPEGSEKPEEPENSGGGQEPGGEGDKPESAGAPEEPAKTCQELKARAEKIRAKAIKVAAAEKPRKLRKPKGWAEPVAPGARLRGCDVWAMAQVKWTVEEFKKGPVARGEYSEIDLAAYAKYLKEIKGDEGSEGTENTGEGSGAPEGSEGTETGGHKAGAADNTAEAFEAYLESRRLRHLDPTIAFKPEMVFEIEYLEDLEDNEIIEALRKKPTAKRSKREQEIVMNFYDHRRYLERYEKTRLAERIAKRDRFFEKLERKREAECRGEYGMAPWEKRAQKREEQEAKRVRKQQLKENKRWQMHQLDDETGHTAKPKSLNYQAKLAEAFEKMEEENGQHEFLWDEMYEGSESIEMVETREEEMKEMEEWIEEWNWWVEDECGASIAWGKDREEAKHNDYYLSVGYLD